ncbi:hypothetical protein CDAR_179521 [Caerostris darwini]|uniref:Uncharacterized protein n=1 Tax=Caerostris darwini TaxID=1538125 RepID=A0AAV4P3V0_9ARAC|nr:hypothetical protein CDAR_179521 [Caerostris darwini]
MSTYPKHTLTSMQQHELQLVFRAPVPNTIANNIGTNDNADLSLKCITYVNKSLHSTSVAGISSGYFISGTCRYHEPARYQDSQFPINPHLFPYLDD